jgi:chromate transporter
VTSRSERDESSALEVFLVASKLGISSFGGPAAHLGYFREEYVRRRNWLDEQTYADMVALCQSLPGPTSTETGIAIGLLRAGPLGAFAAWLGFTLPSAVLMFALAYLDRLTPGISLVFPVLRLVAFVVVALAVWRMARALAWDVRRGAIALASATAVLVAPSSPIQVAAIAAAALLGWRFLPVPPAQTRTHVPVPIGRRTATACLALYLALLVALPIAAATIPNGDVRLVDSFYRSGALVFGGGHVVLPLLHAEVVKTHGWVSEDKFVTGYGAAQLVPGPLFTFATYLGASITPTPCATEALPCGDLFLPWPHHGPLGAALATIAIFLPSFLLVLGALPSWGWLRTRPWAQSALRGVNACVVGLLIAALVDVARAIASTFV